MRTQRASSTSPSRPSAPENRSVGRILDVLDLFLDGGETYTLKDVSEALGIPKSTAHGILHAMRGKGYLTVDPETKRYAVSLGLVGRLSATPTVEILRRRARRHLERLSTTLGETTKLIVFERTHSVAIDFVDGAGPLKYAVTLGQRWPFHATGGGKLYLAQFDDERLRELLTEKPLEQITPQTVVDVDALLAEVAEVRRNGWARQREEIHEGIAGFAAPVVDAAGKLLGALVVMGPTARIDEHADGIVAAMLAEAQALSVEVGALPPERGRHPPSVSSATATQVDAAPGRSFGAIAVRVLLPALTFVVLIGAWWLATIVFDWPPYIVPTPLEVWQEMIDQRSILASNFTTTLWEALLGFALAIAIAIPCAVAIAYSRTLELTVYPTLVALNAIPKIAIAPLLVIWMGFGAGPKIVMVILICFFPIVISTATGIKATPAEITELSRSLSTSTLQDFVRFRFPWSLPYVFVGLKVAIALAVIGAVVGEFVGATKGLGYVIVASGQNANTTLAFAAIVLLSLMSIVLYYAVALLERVLVPWSEET